MFSCAAKGAYGPPARPPPPLADDDTPPQNPCRRWRRRRRPIAPGRPTTFAPCFFTATRRTEARGEGLLCGGSLSPPRPRPFTTATSLPGRSSQPCWGSTRKNVGGFSFFSSSFSRKRTRLLKRPPPWKGLGRKLGVKRAGRQGRGAGAERKESRLRRRQPAAMLVSARSNPPSPPSLPSLPLLPPLPPLPFLPSPPSAFFLVFASSVTAARRGLGTWRLSFSCLSDSSQGRGYGRPPSSRPEASAGRRSARTRRDGAVGWTRAT